jgi:membrane protein implicated in regulation of membrane protease activity
VSAWIWLIIAAVFAVVEVTNFAFYAVFLAVGALAAAVAAIAGGGLVAELLAFGGTTIGGLILLRKPMMAMLAPHGRGLVSGAQGLVGKTGTVVKQVHGPHQPGLVHAHGEDWPAISYDDEPHEPGEVVVILELDRTRLVVTND